LRIEKSVLVGNISIREKMTAKTNARLAVKTLVISQGVLAHLHAPNAILVQTLIPANGTVTTTLNSGNSVKES
jgi:hypothetical protein